MSWSEEHIEIIGKYLNGEANAEEVFAAKELIEDNPEEFSAYEKLWEKSQMISFDADAAWEKVMPKLNLEPIQEAKVIKRSYGKVVALIAAAFVGVGLFLFVQQNDSGNLIQVASLDKEQDVTLFDGTDVDLAAHSELKYEEKKGVRSVKLKGKAFFDVQRDTTKPFVITAEKAVVQVLGTSFEVSALPSDTMVLVSVSSGRVMVYSQGQNYLHPSEHIILLKGERGYLSKRTGRVVKMIPDQNLNHPNKLRFKDMSLVDICDSLETIFKISIDLEDKTINDCGNVSNIKVQKPTIESCLQKIEEGFDRDENLPDIIFEKQSPGKYLVKGKGC